MKEAMERLRERAESARATGERLWTAHVWGELYAEAYEDRERQEWIYTRVSEAILRAMERQR